MFRNNSRQNVAGVGYWHSKGEISRRTLSFFSLAYYEHSRGPFHTGTIPGALLGF